MRSAENSVTQLHLLTKNPGGILNDSGESRKVINDIFMIGSVSSLLVLKSCCYIPCSASVFIKTGFTPVADYQRVVFDMCIKVIKLGAGSFCTTFLFKAHHVNSFNTSYSGIVVTYNYE